MSSFADRNSFASQTISLQKSKQQPVGVYMSVEQLMGKQTVKVIRDSTITKS
jgi:hypothetical protein